MNDEVLVDDMPDFWMEEPGLDDHPHNGILGNLKRKARSHKKMVFVGWGSGPLIEFLESIGKDTTKQISHFEVTAIVNEYVRTKNLVDPDKKKRILCDERLRSLFGKKSLARIKIHDFLEKHFAENQDESDDDFLYGSEDDNKKVCKQQKVSRSDPSRNLHPNKRIPETSTSSFAAVIPANIKLLYLKRTLVQDLLHNEEDKTTLESKLVGSFVRVKSDPNDYLQKNSHQLLQVTGMKRPSGVASDTCSEILLQVSNMVDDIHIYLLSDDNFSEEECEDLRERTKDGTLKRLTVVEFQEKAKLLHKDITKHWLARELNLLQNLIDRANEKGWRKELFEYLERKEMLQTPAEQKRLLHEVPKVIADDLEAQHEAAMPHEEEEGCNSSPRSTLLRSAAPLVSTTDYSEAGVAQTLLPGKDDVDKVKRPPENQLCVQIVEQQNTLHAIEAAAACSSVDHRHRQKSGDEGRGFAAASATPPREVIELVSDDDEGGGTTMTTCWHYVDPQGAVQGPFSLDMLKRWSEANYFPPDFKVFQITGQSRVHNPPILLSQLLTLPSRNAQ